MLFGMNVDLHTSVLLSHMLSRMLTLFVTMQGCDAVLALRGKIKAGGWLRTAAKGFAVPIFSVKTSSPDHLTRAVQTILGLEPSPGGLFGASRAGSVESASSSNSESQQGVCNMLLRDHLYILTPCMTAYCVTGCAKSCAYSGCYLTCVMHKLAGFHRTGTDQSEVQRNFWAGNSCVCSTLTLDCRTPSRSC